MYSGTTCLKTIQEVDSGLAALKLQPQRFQALQENIRIRVLGFVRRQYHIQWSLNQRATPIQKLINHLKKIIEEENPDNILPEPPIQMPQRPKLPILGQIVAKVKEIDDKMNEGNAKLIKASN